MLSTGDDGVFHEPSARERQGHADAESGVDERTSCNACGVAGQPLVAQTADGVDITICVDTKTCVSRFKATAFGAGTTALYEQLGLR